MGRIPKAEKERALQVLKHKSGKLFFFNLIQKKIRAKLIIIDILNIMMSIA